MTNPQIVLAGVWTVTAVMWAAPAVRGGTAIIMTIIAGVVSACLL